MDFYKKLNEAFGLDPPEDDRARRYQQRQANRAYRRPIGATELSASSLGLGDIYNTFVVIVKYPAQRALFILQRNNYMFDKMRSEIKKRMPKRQGPSNELDNLVRYLWRLVDKQEVEYRTN
jgi:hypothetical protein